MSWYLKVLKNYAVFRGRARRKEYWMFILVNVIVSVVLIFLDGALGTIDPESGVGLFNSLYTLGVLVPTLAVTARRLHDTNRSGWWQLISLVPLIGFFVLLFFTVLDGDQGTNRFGEDPKAGEPV